MACTMRMHCYEVILCDMKLMLIGLELDAHLCGVYVRIKLSIYFVKDRPNLCWFDAWTWMSCSVTKWGQLYKAKSLLKQIYAVQHIRNDRVDNFEIKFEQRWFSEMSAVSGFSSSKQKCRNIVQACRTRATQNESKPK